MAEAVKGTKIVYPIRVHATTNAPAASLIAFTTENTRTKSKDADSVPTKDGSIRTPGAIEQEIECTALLKKGDTLISTLETAMDNDSLIDIWEANLEEPGSTTGKYKGRYFQGYITEMEVSSSSEDFAEVSLTIGVNGVGVEGDVTVTTAQVAAATYSFADTTAIGSGSPS